MGTNVYAHHLFTCEEKERLHRAIDSNDIKTVHELTGVESVHICKISAGWQVDFDHNWGKYYQPSRKSLIDYLSRPDIAIIDEYGKHYAPAEFWNMIDKHNANDFNHFTSSTYRDWECKEHPEWGHTDYHQEDRDRCRHLFGVEAKYGDFTVDGLRFAVYTNFC